MKKKFLYFFIVIWIILVASFYSKYTQTKEQNTIIKNKDLLYKFNLAQELLQSKLKNIYFQDFNNYTIKEILSKNSKEMKMPLKTIVETKFYKYKDFLKELTIYDTKGNIMFSSNEKDINKLNFNIIKNTSKPVFAYFDKNNKSYIFTLPVNFQGSTIAYIKQTITFDKFMKNFFASSDYLFIKSNKKFDKTNYPLNFQAINNKSFFAVLLKKKNNIEEYLLKNLMIETLLSFIFLISITYIIYKNLLKEQKLKQNISRQKEFFEKIIEASSNPIFVLDEHKKYILANHATAKMFNIYNSDLLINNSNMEIFKDKTFTNILEKDQNYVLKNNQTVCRKIHKIQDQYYKFTFIPINNLKYLKKEKIILGFATNITTEVERKIELDKHNTKLKMEIFDEMSNRMKINEKFKKIFDNIDDAMFICTVNKDGKLSGFLDVNTAGEKFLENYNYNNIDPNEIFKHLKFIYNENKHTIEITNNNYIETIKKNNTICHLKVICHLVLLENKYNAIIFVQNIDEIIKLKKEKRQQQTLIENIFKKASSGIAVINKKGEFIKYNHSFFKILGYEKKEFKQKDFYSLFEKNKLETIKDEHKNLFDDKKELSKEYTLLTSDGSSVIIIASSTLIKNDNNNIYRLFIFENITKIKQLEKEHRQNNKIIAQQSKMAEMGEMIGAIAHQWRQPLNAINAAAIKLNLSSSLGILQSKEVMEKTKFIEKQSVKMSDTINDFMNFFKPSKNKEYFLVNDIYKKIFDFLEPQFKNRNITLKLKTDQELKLYGFQNEFEHILLNLINNAKDAFESYDQLQSKSIEVYFYKNESNSIIEVVDNAGGIPQSILNKIFNPYFTTKEEGKGTGIGLYMTKTIIEKHFEGTIEVNNNENGATFTLTIPKRRANEQV